MAVSAFLVGGIVGALSGIYGILLPKLFWPTAMWEKNCSSYPNLFLKFDAEGREFDVTRTIFQTVKGQNNFW